MTSVMFLLVFRYGTWIINNRFFKITSWFIILVMTVTYPLSLAAHLSSTQEQ